MKTYFEHVIVPNEQSQTVRLLKKACQEHFLQGVPDPVFSLAYDRDDYFFLKTHRDLLWGRVFFEALTQELMDQSDKEYRQWRETFQAEIQGVIFCKGVVPGVRHAWCKSTPRNPRFFDYSFLTSKQESALALREWISPSPPRLDEVPVQHLMASEPSVSKYSGGYRFFKHASLSRCELADLIQFCVDLRK